MLSHYCDDSFSLNTILCVFFLVSKHPKKGEQLYIECKTRRTVPEIYVSSEVTDPGCHGRSYGNDKTAHVRRR